MTSLVIGFLAGAGEVEASAEEHRDASALERRPESMSRQLSSGSYTKASSTAITLSLCRCSTSITDSQVQRYVPSIPVTWNGRVD